MRLGLLDRSGGSASTADAFTDRTPVAPTTSDLSPAADDYSSRIKAIGETIDLLEADLSAMIRDVHRTSDAVRNGIRSSASALVAIPHTPKPMATNPTPEK